MVKKTTPSHMIPLSDSSVSKAPSPTKTVAQVPTVELIADSQHPEDVVYQLNGKKTVISETDIKELLREKVLGTSRPDSSEKDSLISPTQTLGLVGLQNAKQVADFWKSAGGKTVKKLINDQLIQIAEMRESQRQSQMDAAIRRHRLLAFLIMAAIYKKKAHAKKLHEIIQQQINATLNLNKTQSEQQSSPSPAEVIAQALIQSYAAHVISAQMLQSALEEKMAESQQLENEIASLEKAGEKIIRRYDALENHLQDLDAHYELWDQQSPEAQMTEIERMLAELSEKIEAKRQEIDQLIVENRDEEAFTLLEELNGLNAQDADLRDKLDSLKGEKRLFNSNGEEISSLKDAEYILSNKKVLAKDNDGKFYLLEPGQNLSNMRVEEKAQAARNFEHALPDMKNLRKLVQGNRTLETDLNNSKKNDAFKRSYLMQKELLDLSNQLTQVQALMANTVHSMQELQESNPNLNLKIPTPRPVIKETKALDGSKAASLIESFKHVLDLLKRKPTSEGIEQFKRGFLKNGKPDLDMQKIIANSIIPGVPIPPTTYQRLLASIEQFSKTAYPKDMTRIDNPLQRELHPPSRTPGEPRPTPSPFSDKPKGF